MASLLLALAVGLLATSSKAAPSHAHRSCINLNLSVPVTANNSIYDITRVDKNLDLPEFVWDLERWTAPPLPDRIKGVYTVTQNFTINAQLCMPEKSDKENILQIATHGFGFEKT